MAFHIRCILCVLGILGGAVLVPPSWAEVRAAERPELFLQTGHSSMITAVAYSPDGRYIATSSGDRNARLWDAKTGFELRRFFGHAQMVLSVAFSPDGKQLLTGSFDKTARLWDVATAKELHRFECDTLMVPTAVFSPDGKQALTACYANAPDFRKGTARLWDAATGKLLQTFAGHDGYVTSAVFSPDGKQVLTGSHDATARLWDSATGRETRRFVGHAAPIRSVAFSAEGKLVATGADDKTARQWDPTTGKEVHRFTAPGLLTFSVLVLPGARRAGTAPLDGSAYLYDIATGKELCKVRGHAGVVSCGAFSPDDRRIVTGSLDATARIWDVATGKELHRLESRCGEVGTAAFSPDGKWILTGGKDGVARLWDAALGRELRQFVGHTSGITAGAFSSDGRRIVTSSGGYKTKDHTARVWDVSTGKELHYFLGHTDSVNAVAFSPDGRQIVTGSDDKTARLWDTTTGKEIRRIEGHAHKVTAVAFSADGSQVLTGSWDCTARLWDAATGKEIKRFETAPTVSLVQAVAFSPDGRHLLTGDFNSSSRLYGIATGKEVRRFQIDRDPNDVVVTGTASVSFSPDGRRILTAVDDRTVRMWDAATGMEMRRLEGHTGVVYSAVFSPDGRRMLTASEDGTSRVWDAASGRELARLVGLRKGGEWVAVTPEGYFDGSLDGRRLVMWRVGGELFPLESYEKKFHRPDLVAKALSGQPIEDQPSLPVDRTPPKVSLAVEEAQPESATVKVTAAAGSKAASIVSIRVTVDGRDLSPKRGTSIVRKRVAEGKVAFRATVDFPPGKQNTLVAAMVTDDFGLQSDPVELLVERPVKAKPAPSTLYVLTVGISRYKNPQYNLSFCHADAEALATMFERQKGRAFPDVRTYVCIDEGATASNVAAGLRWFQQSCSPADVAIVLFAGHGCLGDDGLYYLTYDADLDDLKNTSLSWEDMARGLKTIQARQVLFFSDCCHAGAFGGQAATQDQLAESLVKEAGVMVFASSRGNEKSAERGEWGHGAFVRALLDGLDGRADLIADGQINVSELQTYVVDQVSKLTDDSQHPYIPRLERFDPGLVLALTK